MKELGIDIETYSSNDLVNCGVYKYVEAPDFTILLFSYSVDGTRGDHPTRGSVLISFGKENADILQSCGIYGKFVWLQ